MDDCRILIDKDVEGSGSEDDNNEDLCELTDSDMEDDY